MKNNNTNIYFSAWLALIPLAVFIVGAMYLGLNGSPDEYGFWPIMVVSLIIALLLSKSKNRFSEIVIKGMSDKLVMLMILAWLLSSVVGIFMSETNLIETIINLYLRTNLGGGVFVVAVFIIAAITGTSTGTAVGTVLIVTPVLFKAGITLGIDPYLLLGAILSGGAFGDDFSPLSDTTIAVASTQNVDIGKSVRSRLKYAITAAIPAVILFYFIGSNTEVNGNIELLPIDYYSLLMLLSPIVVILLCMLGKHILSALLSGILVAIVISLSFNLISLTELFSLDTSNFSANSIIIDGMKKGVGISVFSILLIGLVSFILDSGLIEKLIKLITHKVKSKSIGEIVIVAMTILFNSFLAHNTITIMSIGAVVKRISENLKINGYRSANLMDISGNTVMHIFPYMITVILATSIANDLNPYTLNPFQAGLHNYHSIFLLVVAIIVSISGVWRRSDAKYLDY